MCPSLPPRQGGIFARLVPALLLTFMCSSTVLSFQVCTAADVYVFIVHFALIPGETRRPAHRARERRTFGPAQECARQTVLRSEQYRGLLADVQRLQHETAVLREQLHTAQQSHGITLQAQDAELEQNSGRTMQHGLWHQHYTLQLASARTSHAKELLLLKSQHEGTLRTLETSHCRFSVTQCILHMQTSGSFESAGKNDLRIKSFEFRDFDSAKCQCIFLHSSEQRALDGTVVYDENHYQQYQSMRMHGSRSKKPPRKKSPHSSTLGGLQIP